ncbi:glycoside hydrolase family 130 protein [Thermoproteota archaeon]
MKFTRYRNNPILKPDSKNWYEKECVYNPCAVVHKGKIFLIYRAEDKAGKYVSRLCLATSTDGHTFKRYGKNPILSPTRPEEKRGCEDPRITKIGDIFYLTYTAYKGKMGKKHNIGLSLATSKDLIKWRKHGVILDSMKAGQIFPEKIGDEYIMFVGEGNIYIARSKDLKKWTLDKKPLLKPRKNMFDEFLVEVGPPPIILKDKIMLIYNASDNNIRYAPSYIILDREDPSKVLFRSEKPMLIPSEEFELHGKVDNVVFAEGLVEFKGKYFLYYGGADKCIGVATMPKL